MILCLDSPHVEEGVLHVVWSLVFYVGCLSLVAYVYRIMITIHDLNKYIAPLAPRRRKHKPLMSNKKRILYSIPYLVCILSSVISGAYRITHPNTFVLVDTTLNICLASFYHCANLSSLIVLSKYINFVNITIIGQSKTLGYRIKALQYIVSSISTIFFALGNVGTFKNGHETCFIYSTISLLASIGCCIVMQIYVHLYVIRFIYMSREVSSSQVDILVKRSKSIVLAMNVVFTTASLSFALVILFPHISLIIFPSTILLCNFVGFVLTTKMKRKIIHDIVKNFLRIHTNFRYLWKFWCFCQFKTNSTRC